MAKQCPKCKSTDIEEIGLVMPVSQCRKCGQLIYG